MSIMQRAGGSASTSSLERRTYTASQPVSASGSAPSQSSQQVMLLPVGGSRDGGSSRDEQGDVRPWPTQLSNTSSTGVARAPTHLQRQGQ